MRGKLRVLVISFAIWFGCTWTALAQLTPGAAIPIVGNYVSSLQAGNIPALQQLAEPFLFQYVMQQTTGTGIYPIVRDLGSITYIQLGSTVSSFSFTAQVQHRNGQSEWQFVLDTIRPIIRAANLLKVIFPAPALPGVPTLRNETSEACRRFPGMCGSGGVIARAENQFGHANAFPSRIPSAPTPPPASTPQNLTVDMPCQNPPAACGARQRIFSNDPRLVEFLFVTDRVPKNGAQAVSFTGDRQGTLTFGAASVHVPETHRMGRIELPSVWKVFGIELRHEPLDERKHFVIRQLQIMTIDTWADLIRRTQAKSALIFVHGFNTSFEDGVLRNAQIIYDLDYRGLSILYSWSSRGAALDYRYDLDSAYAGREGFITLLRMLRDSFGIERVDVLAHSMGNLLVLDALKNSSATGSPARVDELIMASPDVPRDVFERQLPDIQRISSGTTLYASGADKALAASKLLAVYSRAGDVPRAGLPVILPGLDTIDVTEIGDELLGLNHTEFATNRSVMDDLKILLDTRRRASRLSQIRRIQKRQSDHAIGDTFPEISRHRLGWLRTRLSIGGDRTQARFS
ncbi:alpha/beta hydrolase [Bradyrhizobium australiense]|uniref:Alpha/beta hydrolase n=1 Tax=Bradyrhizobium australiense TaxID=2721161 RepID=A0A7Y4GT42_9BRAD|nr:alpha/beta hydrolase [Bradyrhizobium australiense]NOJ41514.1 alpha/beta hydrolase [Bradyrhizobium australiense]